jgi:hypothetical protein
MVVRFQDKQLSDSFLVRCWMEPREMTDEPDIVRVYVRNLRTGEEHYLNQPSQVGEVVERGLQQAAAEATGAVTGRTIEAG